jgi:hypothetical protein
MFSTDLYIRTGYSMGRNITSMNTITFVTIVLISLLAITPSASAESMTITVSGHIQYPGYGGVMVSPSGANVTALYLGHEYSTTSDSSGNYRIGPIDYAQEPMIDFRFYYTDTVGNYYVYPNSGWQRTMAIPGVDNSLNVILVPSTAPTLLPTATPSPTPAPTPSPSPTPLPEVSPSPTATDTTMPTPPPETTATPVPTATPSVWLGGIGAFTALALTVYAVRKKQ